MTYQDKCWKREIHLRSFETAVKVFLEYDFSDDKIRTALIKKAHEELVAKLQLIEQAYQTQTKPQDPFVD